MTKGLKLLKKVEQWIVAGPKVAAFSPLVLQHAASRALHRLGLELERRKAVSRVLRRGAWTVGVCLLLFLLLLA